MKVLPILVSGIAIILSLAAASANMVNAEDLSEEARQFLPDNGNMVDITYTDGRRQRAELVSKTEQELVLRIAIGTGTITSVRTIPRDQVAVIKPVDLAQPFAEGLKQFELNPDTSMEPEEYRRALALFDEYLEFFPQTEDAGWIGERRDAFAGEYAQVQKGLVKIDGDWVSPVQAAVIRFNRVNRMIRELERQHPGLARRTGRQGEEVSERYEELRDQRREIARRVPRLMTERMPLLLEEKRFDEAFSEMNAFLKFWIDQVIQAEASPRDRSRLGREVFEGMDFGYLLRLQNRVMEAYQTEQAEQKEKPPLTVPDNMAYIPGGYFLMGDEKSSPGDDNFPLRAVYIKPFLIDRYEVTNAEYREFVEYVRRTGDYSMSHPSAPPLKDHTPAGWQYPDLSGDHQPVLGVDWHDAYAYLNWRDKRLPTEAEWEMAARSRDGRIYPWGNEPTPSRLIINTPSGRRLLAGKMDEQKPPPPAPPPSRGFSFSCRRPPPPPDEAKKTVLPDVTWHVNRLLPQQAMEDIFEWDGIVAESFNPFAIFHMSGNASVWVADWYDAAYPSSMEWRNPQGPERGEDRVFRGGSYLCPDNEMIASRRRRPTSANHRRGLSANGRPMIGIRGARDMP